jgi:hypothetical protein
VNNRRSEGAQLLNQIEQDKAANKTAQAELERERLRGLMERMSMDPQNQAHSAAPSQASPPPKVPTNSRPTPSPLFAPGNAPRYPQTNFSGQYQLPSSPPPNQTNLPSPYLPPAGGFNQQAYNPSAHGRIPGPASPPPHVTSFGANVMRPGPASPPPTVTSFGIQAMRPGPASPPPTQTSFSQPHQYSTYGNQQATQQLYVPPGFVPPPPPPGPPPLGPQQTYHVQQQANDFYMQRPPSAQQQHPQHPQHPQNPGDPWAGLSAWK